MKKVKYEKISRTKEEETIEKFESFEDIISDEEELEAEESIYKEKNKNVNVLKIHNIMAYANLNCELNLDRICQHFGNAVYNPEEFHCTRIEVRSKEKAVITISIFSNGKMLATGGDSLRNTHRAMKKIARKLKQPPLCYNVKFSEFGVSNSLFTYNTGHPINLNLMQKLCRGADYEPERFPALRIRLIIPASDPKQNKPKAASDNSPFSPSPSSCASSLFPNNQGISKIFSTLSKLFSDEVLFVQAQHKAKKYNQMNQLLGRLKSNNETQQFANKECVTINIFSTGKITFTGVKTLYNIEYAFNYILPFLKKCEAKVFYPLHNANV